MEKKKKKKNSNKLNLIICAIAFVFMLVYVYFVDGFDNIVSSIQQINVGFLLVAMLLMVVYWTMEALQLHAVLQTLSPGQKFYKSLIVAILGQYFNCITPSSTGGQPMQAYYFSKFGVPLSNGVAALLSRFIVYQFVLTVYSVFVLLIRFNSFSEQFAPLMFLVMVGFAINTLVIVFLIMLAFFRAPVRKLAGWIIKLLGKLRIFKTQEVVDDRTAQVNEIIDQYHENFNFIKRKPWLIIRMIFYTVIQLTAYFSISYVIYLGFGLSGTDYLTIISCQAFVLMISGFVPLPGALGAAEGSYTMFFGDIFRKGTHSFVGISTFIWRFLTFYLPIIVGLVISLFLGKVMKIARPDDEETDDKPIELTAEELAGDSVD
ncbi:MAG: flippase-like domain-containing protein [Eubacterium sp.]|nr:flippase-like domain-containing protein [Eubacterium sp.]